MPYLRLSFTEVGADRKTPAFVSYDFTVQVDPITIGHLTLEDVTIALSKLRGPDGLLDVTGTATLAIGNVSTGICVPAGLIRQPLLRRKPPSGVGPGCCRGAGCDINMAAPIMKARSAKRVFMCTPNNAARSADADRFQMPWK